MISFSRLRCGCRGFIALRMGVFVCLGASLFGASTAPTQQLVADGIARESMLLLKGECFSCHNEKKKKGGLVLTSRESLLKGSDSGPVAESGRHESSQLASVLLADADPHMPPERQLTTPQIELMRKWIQGGMAWDEAALLEDDTKPVALSPLPASYHPVLALALAPETKRLAIGRGGSILLHDSSISEFPLLHRIEAHRDAVQSLAWSADGRWLASGAFRRVVWWSGDSLPAQREWTDGLIGKITALQFSPDAGKLVLADGAAGRSGVVRVIDLPEGRVVASWSAHDLQPRFQSRWHPARDGWRVGGLTQRSRLALEQVRRTLALRP